MKMPDELSETMIAACGITCAACYAHLRKNKPCPGRRGVISLHHRVCPDCGKALETA